MNAGNTVLDKFLQSAFEQQVQITGGSIRYYYLTSTTTCVTKLKENNLNAARAFAGGVELVPSLIIKQMISNNYSIKQCKIMSYSYTEGE